MTGGPIVKCLVDALENEGGDVASYAVGALGKIGEPAIEPLIKALGDGTEGESGADADGRTLAAEALGKIGEPAVKPLIELLSDDGWGVRDAAKEALRELGHEVG